MPAGAGEDQSLATDLPRKPGLSSSLKVLAFGNGECLACDPAITARPSPAGLTARRGSHVC